jgi:dTDP-4-amino-4,6-dideoxygalactose transaminase
MVTTNDGRGAERMRRLRNHGVTRDASLMLDPALSLEEPGRPNPWSYEHIELGFNYRMNDLEAALGLSQLARLGDFVARRAALARRYDSLLAPLAPVVRPVAAGEGQSPALHLYGVRIDFAAAGVSRSRVMRRMAEAGVGTQVHYIPLHRQPYFHARYGAQSLPGAEAWYARALTLPLFPAMADEDVDRAVESLRAALG